MAQDLTMELLERIVAAFNAHDADAVAGHFADEGVMLLAAGPEPVGTTIRGPAAIKAALEKRFAACPDIRWTEGRNWIVGNKALSEWRVRATLPDGGVLDTLGCDLWEFEDGRIVKKDTYYKQKA